MKKILLSFLSVLVAFTVLVIHPMEVSANNFTASASVSSVKPNGSFSVTISGISNVRARFDISVSNGSGSTSFSATGQSSQTLNIRAGSSGSVTVTIRISDGATMDEVDITGQSQTLTIPIKQASDGGSGSGSGGSSSGSSGGNTSNQKPPVNLSSNNDLASLSLSQGTLSPEFSADVTEYSVDLPADVTSIHINASASDSKASVSGIGEVSLVAGENLLNVTVTAENGNPKVYTIKAYVDETPLIFVDYNGEELGVVRNLETAPLLEGFEETSVLLEDHEIRAWHSPTRNITVIYLQKDTEKNFYIYDEEKGVVSIYIPMGILGNNLGIIDVPTELQKREGMTFQRVTIEDAELPGWTFNDEAFENYFLIYAMDEFGVCQYYQYESTQGTLQLYSGAGAITQEEYENTISSKNKLQMYLYVSLGVSGILLVMAIVGLVNAHRYKKRLLSREKPVKLSDSVKIVEDQSKVGE